MIGCNTFFVLDNLLLYVLSGSVTPEEIFTYEGHSRKQLRFSRLARKPEVRLMRKFPKQT